MSTSGSRRLSNVLPEMPSDRRLIGYWALAFGGVTLTAAAYLSVLYTVVDVVGGVPAFLLLVGGAIGLGAAFRYLQERTAILVGGVLLGAGLAIYFLTLPAAQIQYLSVQRLIQDNIALMTGYSVLRMRNVQNWALAVTAGPTFLTAYFAFREAFRRAIVVAGLTLGFFVLTGDSGSVVTMIGVLGATAAIGFSTLARHGGSRHQGEILAGLLGLMVISAGTVTAVPGGSSPLVPPGTISTSGDLVSADDRVSVGGSLTLSPKVLFTVDSEEPSYWRVAAYDRFTGDSWLRTGPRSGPPPPRPGPTRTLNQRFTAERPLSVAPAAPTPRQVRGLDAGITEFGTIETPGTLDTGESYVVESERPNSSFEALRSAQGPYPPEIEEQYLQVPSSTSDRVRSLAAEITADQETPYAKARAIEAYLESSKSYSLSVPRPEGNVVNQFLFEMEEGYCVYFASSMVTMLRTQGVPARYVVGYTSGQQITSDTYVVRGLDSHAWVEVYLPERGWTRFDPTPAGPRSSLEQGRIREARSQNESGVDTEQSEQVELADKPAVDPTQSGTSAGLPQNSSFAGDNAIPGAGQVSNLNTSPGLNGSATTGNVSEGGGEEGPSLPPPEIIGLWAMLGVGVVTGARRLRATRRLYRFAWLLRMPTGDPTQSVEGAFERVMYVLERSHRDRQPGETVREYVTAVSGDGRVHSLLRLRERAVYAGRVEEGAGKTARVTARDVLADHAAAYRFFPSTVFNRLLS